jgi:hypothetical protein
LLEKRRQKLCSTQVAEPRDPRRPQDLMSSTAHHHTHRACIRTRTVSSGCPKMTPADPPTAPVDRSNNALTVVLRALSPLVRELYASL